MTTTLWTRDAAVAATGGRCAPDWAASGVSIDTRTLERGDLFVALEAARDGHDFVAEALRRGAAAALVRRRPEGVPEDAPLLLVEDVQAGLEALARAARARMGGRVIAVTGSMGKTGTKEMLRMALGVQGRVHAAEKSYNNHWGVPLTLARMPAETDFAVIEIGMNGPGEIAPLSQLARPHVAMITTVAPVHLAAFRDVRGIAREKASIVRGLEPGGVAVLNRDVETYPILLRAARRVGARPLRFGATGRPEYRLIEARIGAGGTAVRARARDADFLFRIAARGRHLALNALGALAAIEAMGGDIGRAAVALAGWSAPDGRGARWTVSLGPGGLDGSLTLIDESYNANPDAMVAAFQVLAAEEPADDVGRVARGRRLAFLGDMLELGPDEKRLHAGLAAAPALEAIDAVHCAGPLMRSLHAALPIGKRGGWFSSAEEMAAAVRKLVDAGDVAMVKGSNGSRVSLVVEAIRALGTARPADAAAPEG